MIHFFYINEYNIKFDIYIYIYIYIFIKFLYDMQLSKMWSLICIQYKALLLC